MDRIVKRAAQVARTTRKRQTKREQHVKNSKESSLRLQKLQFAKAEKNLIKDARKRRKDEWERGPLAARHDVGEKKKSYGTLPKEMVNTVDEFEARKPEWFHVEAGDRIAVVAGRFKGRIAEIQSLDEDSCTIYAKGIDVDIMVPKHLREMAQMDQAVTARPMVLPLSDIKLIYPLPDEKTGKLRDVIIDRLESVGRVKDWKGKVTDPGYRVIAGTDTIIPWAETTEAEVETYPCDSLKEAVQEVTVRPQLFTAPMPLSVIDELRNKFSKYRTSFTVAERLKIERKAAVKDRRQNLLDTMRTPLQELAMMRAKERKQDVRLTRAQLSAIGAVIRQENPAALRALRASRSLQARQKIEASDKIETSNLETLESLQEAQF